MAADDPSSKERALFNLINKVVLDREYIKNPLAEKSEPHNWIFDFRKILLVPESLTLVVDVLYEKIRHLENFQIGGLESAAIPLVTALALRAHKDGKRVNSFYIVKTSSKIDIEKQIIGTLNDDPIILVDDIMNSSASIMRQIELLEYVGRKVSGVLVIILFRDAAYYKDLHQRKIWLAFIFPKSDFALPERPTMKSKMRARTKPMWTYQADNNSHFTHIYQQDKNNYVFILTNNNVLTVLNNKNGQVVAHYRTKATYSWKQIVTVVGTAVYLINSEGALVLVNFHTHVELFVYNQTASVLTSAEYLPEQGHFVAFLKENSEEFCICINSHGKVQWRTKLTASSCLTPTSIPKKNLVLIPHIDGSLTALRLDDGSLFWRYTPTIQNHSTSPKNIPTTPTYDPKSGVVAYGTSDGYVHLIDAKTGETQHTLHSDYIDTTLKSPIVVPPIFIGDSLIFASWDKHIHSHNKSNWAENFKTPVLGKIDTPIIGRHGVLWVLTRTGHMYGIDAQSGEHLSQHALDGRMSTLSTPANNGAQYIVADTDNTKIIVLRNKSSLIQNEKLPPRLQ